MSLDKSNAVVTLLSDQATDIVWRLHTSPNIGKRLNIKRSHGAVSTFSGIALDSQIQRAEILVLEYDW